MRWLPRTPRGNWLLAAVVWLAGCGIGWPLLPDVPRAVIPAEQAGVPILFSNDGTRLLARGYGSKSRDNVYALLGGGPNVPGELSDGPLLLFDAADGRCLASRPIGPGALAVHALSPDGRTVAGSDSESLLLDLFTGRAQHLPRVTASLVGYWVSFSPDGRFCVFPTSAPEFGPVCWWDVEQGRAALSGQRGPSPVFSPDGRWAAAAPKDDQGTGVEIRAWPDGARKTYADIDMPSSMWLSADGRYLVVQVPQGTGVISSEDGRQRAWLPWAAHVAVPAGADEVVSLTWKDGAAWLTYRDLRTGAPSGWRHLALPVPELADPPVIHVATHSGRFGLWCQLVAPSPLEQWLASVPFLSRLVNLPSGRYFVIDTATGQIVSSIRSRHAQHFILALDGGTVLAVGMNGRLEFWDLPPRKPLTWLAVAAFLWALPLAWLTRRRARRLRLAV